MLTLGPLEYEGTLDEETRVLMEGIRDTLQSIADLPVQEQRAIMRKNFTTPEDQLVPIHKVATHEAQGRYGPIPLRIYHPSTEKGLPIIVYFHGGGWVFGSSKQLDGQTRRLSNTANAIVVSVDYSLAPEHKFPRAAEDCFDATEWVIKEAGRLGGSRERIVVGGDSAGGNLAAVVSQMYRDRGRRPIAAQVLMYPILSCLFNEAHYKNCPDQHLLTLPFMQWFRRQYIADVVNWPHPYASPINAGNLDYLPSTLIISAQYDPLHAESFDYIDRLNKAGVVAKNKIYPKAVHGFLNLPVNQEVVKEAFNDIADFINQNT